MKREKSLNQFNKHIIQSSFLRAAEACVRIGHFGSASRRLVTNAGSFFENLADVQAHDDLIALAIAGRRLADVGGFTKQARKQKISYVAPVQISPSQWNIRSTGNRTDLYRLFDCLIHSTIFDVISNDYKVKSYLGKLPEDIYQEYQEARFKTEFKPIIAIATNEKPLFICAAEDIAYKTMLFLDHVSDQLSDDDEIWLGNNNLFSD